MQLSDAFIDLLSEKFLYASLVVQEPASRWMDQLFDGVPENESLKWNYNNYLLLESKQVRIPVRAIIGTYEYNSKSFLWGLPSHPFYEMAKEENVLHNLDTALIKKFCMELKNEKIEEFSGTGIDEVEPEIMDMAGFVAANYFLEPYYKYGIMIGENRRIDYVLLLNIESHTEAINLNFFPSVNDMLEKVDRTYGVYPIDYKMAISSFARQVPGISGNETRNADGSIIELKDESTFVRFVFNSDDQLMKRSVEPL